ncbi:MAG: alpha/beta hydrolase [Pseudomonadota bacterium]
MIRILALTVLILVGLKVDAEAETRRDVAYGPHPDHLLDIYSPADSRNAPILVHLHGGGWAMGDKAYPGTTGYKVDHWGGQGWIFVSVSTRLLPDADPVGQAHDLARALAFVQRNATRWGGDSDRLILMGHSAGAHVAMLLAAREDIQETHGLRSWRGTISLDTAALDVVELMRRRPGYIHRAAFGPSLSYWLDASPAVHASRDMAPALLVCSTQRTRPCAAALSVARRAPATVMRVNLSHSEINRELGKPGPYTSAVDSWLRRQGLP